MLQNAYLDVKIGVDTEQNEPSKVDLIFFNFHPPLGFNFHRAAPPSQQCSLLHRHDMGSDTMWMVLGGLDADLSKSKIFDFIGFFIIKSERIFLVLQREQTDLVELCFKHL